MINEYFDKIFCINLKDREDRWESAQAEFQKHNLVVERVDAVDSRRTPSIVIKDGPEQIGYGARGCSLSHVKVLQNMIDNNIQRALILEDDICFKDDLQMFFHHRERFIPGNWDILYLGGNHIGKLIVHNGPIYRTDGTYTTGSYGITLEFAKIAIAKIKELTTPVDVVYSRLAKHFKMYTFNPGIAWQKAGHSDVENEFKDYEWHLKKKNPNNSGEYI